MKLKSLEAKEAAADPSSHDAHEHAHAHGHSHGGSEHMEGLDKAIGVSLVLGFVFMLLIDQLASSSSASKSSLEAAGGNGASAREGKRHTHERLAALEAFRFVLPFIVAYCIV